MNTMMKDSNRNNNRIKKIIVTMTTKMKTVIII